MTEDMVATARGFSHRSVLWVAPRLHTNYQGWVNALHRAGVDNDFLVNYITDDDLPGQRVQLLPEVREEPRKRGALSRFFANAFRSVARRGTPSLVALVKYCLASPASLVITRDFGLHSLVVVWSLKAFTKKNVLIYHQSPVLEEKSPILFRLARYFRRVVLFCNVRSISPVLSRQTRNSGTPFSYEGSPQKSLVPFVMAPSEVLTISRDLPLRLLAVGKFRPYKKHDLLIEALRHLSTGDRRAVAVTVVGSAQTDSERALARSIRAKLEEIVGPESVSVEVNIPFASMLEVYQRHAILVLTNDEEVASIAVLEAMAAGLAPIVANSNGTNGYIVEGVSGLSFSPGSPEELAKCISRCLRDIEAVEDLRRNARFEIAQVCSEANFLESLAQAASPRRDTR